MDCRLSATVGVMRRVVLVVVLMCAIVSAQAVSLVTEQFHEHSSQHCCALCHAGPLPFVQPSLSAVLRPVLSVAWLEPSSDLDATHEVLLASGSSRAPPA